MSLDIFLSLSIFFSDIDVFLDMLFWVGVCTICDGTALTALDEKTVKLGTGFERKKERKKRCDL